jgi:hypothetical protein
MTRRNIRHLLLTGGLWLAAPPLAVAQSTFVEGARAAAAGTAVFVIFIAVIALLFVTLHHKHKKDLFARFIDKGQEIPAALLPRAPSRERELRRGIWLTSLGLGVGLVLYIATGNLRIAAWCLILLSLGAASFVNAALLYPDASGSKRDGDR